MADDLRSYYDELMEKAKQSGNNMDWVNRDIAKMVNAYTGVSDFANEILAAPTSALATPAYNQVKTGDFSYKDAMTGIMDKNKKDWTSVVKERYPKMSPIKQKAYGMFLNALLDPINLIGGVGMVGGIKKVKGAAKGLDAYKALNKEKKLPVASSILESVPKISDQGYLAIKGKDTLGRDIPNWGGARVYHATDKASFKDISQKGYRILGKEAKDGQGGYYGEATSFTPTKAYAEQFGNVLTEATLSKDIKILNLNDPKDWDTYMAITKGGSDLSKLRQQVTKAGYDGVYDAGAGDLFLYNPEKAKLIKEARAKFGMNLDVDAKKYITFVNANRNKISIHPNSKTGMSLEFSTDCPKRASGACAYCYIEHPRTKDMLKIPQQLSAKRIVETPYRDEIAGMPDSLVKELNKDGGLRVFSTGDYRPDLDFDNMSRALQHAEQKNLMLKAITKQPEFVNTWGNHPNLRINISTDQLPKGMSNAPTIDEAVKLAGGRENIKIRSVALNQAQARQMAADPRIDVVTLYHGPTNFSPEGVRHDKLYKLVVAQNPELVKRLGPKALKKELDTWQNMHHNSPLAQELRKKANNICCGGGKCATDKTKCGFGIGALLAGVYIPEWYEVNYNEVDTEDYDGQR